VTETTVLSPLSPVVPATLAVTPEGMRASTGARQGVDQALAGLTRSTAWLAALLVVAGVVSLVARFWLPFIPVNASVMLLASAAALYAFPILVDRYLPYVALGLAAVAGLWLWGWFDNRNKMRTPA
jgi:hypothetical protein